MFDRELRVVEVARPVALPHEALIRVRLAGICGTDLEITRGYKGFRGIIGHEFVGDVVEAADEEWIGKRVCGEINVWCGECAACARGHRSHCSRRSVVGILHRPGVFAEYVTLPICNLHSVPESVDDDAAVFTEPLAAAFEILEQCSPSHDDAIVVLGDGKLGLLCAAALHSAGFSPLVIGKHPEKLALAAEWGIPSAFADAVHLQDVDMVVEATGTGAGMSQAMEILRPRGTLVLKSTIAAPTSLDMSPVVVKELAVVGSRCGPFARALEALRTGTVQPQKMIDSRYPLADALTAVKRASTPGVLKVLIAP